MSRIFRQHTEQDYAEQNDTEQNDAEQDYAEQNDVDNFVTYWGGIAERDGTITPIEYKGETPCITESYDEFLKIESLQKVSIRCITGMERSKWNGYFMTGLLTDGRFLIVQVKSKDAIILIAPKAGPPLKDVFGHLDGCQKGTLGRVQAAIEADDTTGSRQALLPGCIGFRWKFSIFSISSISQFLAAMPFK